MAITILGTHDAVVLSWKMLLWLSSQMEMHCLHAKEAIIWGIFPKMGEYHQLTPVLEPGSVPESWPGSRGSLLLMKAANETASLCQGLVVCKARNSPSLRAVSPLGKETFIIMGQLEMETLPSLSQFPRGS